MSNMILENITDALDCAQSFSEFNTMLKDIPYSENDLKATAWSLSQRLQERTEQIARVKAKANLEKQELSKRVTEEYRLRQSLQDRLRLKNHKELL